MQISVRFLKRLIFIQFIIEYEYEDTELSIPAMHGRLPCLPPAPMPEREKSPKEGVATVLPSESNEVTVKVLKRATFEHELVSNGKVTGRCHGGFAF